jgi:cyclophilin family peptidyl-prolyl cis-trans isomerase
MSNGVMLQIVRAEDERRWGPNLLALLADRNTEVRRRAALAAGRIGDERALPALVSLLQQDSDEGVRARAAFALGELESAAGADALTAALSFAKREPAEIRARAVEALGKIVAALPKSEEARARPLRQAIVGVLEFEAGRRSLADREVVLLSLTAALRARPENAGKVIARFLGYSDPRVRADAANTLARLRLKDGNEELRKLLTSDPDAIVRANAARVLGATEDKAAFNVLLDRLTKDTDLRVRVSAIRSLGNLKDGRAAGPLIERGSNLLLTIRSSSEAADRAASPAYPRETNELLEVATALGRILQGTADQAALAWLRPAREQLGRVAPELEIAFAQVAPSAYLSESGTGADAKRKAQELLLLNWKASASLAQGLGAIAALPDSTRDKTMVSAQAEDILRAMLDYRSSGLDIKTLVAVHSEYAIPAVLRALAAFKPKDLDELLRTELKEADVVIRATAAELPGTFPAADASTRALVGALPIALGDMDLNDAALAILDALGKQKSAAANEAIKTALDSADHLVRRRAVALLKANSVGDFSDRIGVVQTRNTTADYQRALARIGKQVRATVTTSKGAFVIELLPEAAPLTVDNFVGLARQGYFNGQTVPRVVPNFVIQTGDSRGDQNGGPGYQIRCEVNEVRYDRGVVGMALSGKDTGGSQWFVTHSPQPHLDGGYTVFGRVIQGMEVVDRLARGDTIQAVSIAAGAQRIAKPQRVKTTAGRPQKRA